MNKKDVGGRAGKGERGSLPLRRWASATLWTCPRNFRSWPTGWPLIMVVNLELIPKPRNAHEIRAKKGFGMASNPITTLKGGM